jgi:hypothetical protein
VITDDERASQTGGPRARAGWTRGHTVITLFDEMLSATVVYNDYFGGKAALLR